MPVTPISSREGSEQKQPVDLLPAIHAAIASIQEAVATQRDILNLVQAQITSLGLRGGLSTLDDTGETLTFQMVALPPNLEKVIRRMEKLIGYQARGYSISLSEHEVYREAVKTGKAQFRSDSSSILTRIIPKRAEFITRRILSLLGSSPSIYAPLITGGRVIGVLNIVGSGLTEDSLPTMEVFASHIAIALENARLISELRASDRKNRSLIEDLPLGFYQSTPDGRILDANPALLQILGHDDLESLLETNAAAYYVDPGERDKWQATIMEKGILKHFETRLRKKDGMVIWVRMTVRPIYNDAGEIILFEGVMSDITDHKANEEEIRLRTEDLTFINQVSGALNRGERLEDIFKLIAGRIKVMFDIQVVALFLYKEEENLLEMQYLDSPDGMLSMIQNVIGSSLDKVRTSLVEDSKFSEAFLEREIRIYEGQDEMLAFGAAYIQGIPFPDSILQQLESLLSRIFESLATKTITNIPLIFEDKSIGLLTSLSRRKLTASDLNRLGVIFEQFTAAIMRTMIENARKVSEERYRQVSELVSDFAYAFRVEPDGSLVKEWVTEALVRMSGWTVEELALRGGWQALIYPDDLYIAEKQYHALMGGKAEIVEYRILTKHGQIKWVMDYARPEMDKEKTRVVRIYGAVQDVTGRKKVEDEILELKDFHEGIVQNLTDVVIVTDREGYIQFLNAAVEHLLGYSQDELIGEHWLKLVSPDQLYIAKAADKRRERGEKDIYELDILSKDDERRTVVVSGTPINEDGVFDGSLAIFTNITERKKAEEKLIYDAFHDALTNLPNRSLFTDRLGIALERVKRKKQDLYAVLFLDLDHFKDVNDSLGHMIGDKLLISVAHRLKECVRSIDTIARFGGDEFVILLEGVEGEDDTLNCAKRILEDLKAPFRIDNHVVFTSASIGIVLGFLDYHNTEEILSDADIAMYKAKELGRDRYEVFSASMRYPVIARVALENELRRAYENQEFKIYYQPIFDLNDQRITSFEALIRWENPERGLLLPAEFLGVAEDSGLFISIGRWILSEACRQVRGWQLKNPSSSEIAIAINLSERQFKHPELIEWVNQVLEETGLSGKRLRFEITEGVIMDNAVVSANILSQLRSLGIEIQMDDFGTGYSSLGVLHQFPIDGLKIDRSFISQMSQGEEKLSFVQMMLNLAHGLGIDAIAEGVETTEQIALLKSLGCAYAQGNLYSKAVEPDEAQRLIEKYQCSRKSSFNL